MHLHRTQVSRYLAVCYIEKWVDAFIQYAACREVTVAFYQTINLVANASAHENFCVIMLWYNISTFITVISIIDTKIVSNFDSDICLFVVYIKIRRWATMDSRLLALADVINSAAPGWWDFLVMLPEYVVSNFIFRYFEKRTVFFPKSCIFCMCNQSHANNI